MASSLSDPPPSLHNGDRSPSPVRLFALWIQPLAIVVVLLLLSLKPPDDIGIPPIPYIDKVIHFLVYGLIATGFYRAATASFSATMATWLAIFLTIFVGGVDEIWQSFFPTRTTEWADWIADTSGSILAVFLYRYWSLYRTILEWPQSRIKKSRSLHTPDLSNIPDTNSLRSGCEQET